MKCRIYEFLSIILLSALALSTTGEASYSKKKTRPQTTNPQCQNSLKSNSSNNPQQDDSGWRAYAVMMREIEYTKEITRSEMAELNQSQNIQFRSELNTWLKSKNLEGHVKLATQDGQDYIVPLIPLWISPNTSENVLLEIKAQFSIYVEDIFPDQM